MDNFFSLRVGDLVRLSRPMKDTGVTTIFEGIVNHISDDRSSITLGNADSSSDLPTFFACDPCGNHMWTVSLLSRA